MAATYLEEKQWSKHTHETQPLPTNKIISREVIMNTEEIALIETQAAVKKLKNHKSGGPDGITTEAFKAMDDEALAMVTELMNEWWKNEKLEDEVLQARVVHIYKKGNTSDMANYRPISLLNSLYKIFACIIQKRVSDGIDVHMQRTEYGFRKAKSTQQAIHIVRRILEAGESSTGKLLMVLLDWEKAFDKLTR